MSIRDYPGLKSGVVAKLPGDWGVTSRRVETVEESHSDVCPAENTLSLGSQHDPSSPPATPITYVIPGRPMGKPRMTRRDKWAKRDCVVRYWAWADLVRQYVVNPPPAEKVLHVSITAYFVPPKSWSKKKAARSIGQLHRVKPDVSNITKGVEDIIWPENDSAIASVSAVKRWGLEDKLEIKIEVLP